MQYVFLLPEQFDFMAYGVVEGFRQLQKTVLYSATSNGAVKSDRGEIIQAVKNSATVLLFISYTSKIPEEICKLPIKNLVFVDGSDFGDFELLKNYASLLREPDSVFKREMFKSQSYPKNVHPLQFCATEQEFSRLATLTNKDILISFAANLRTNPLRRSIKNLLDEFHGLPTYNGNSGECSYSMSAPQAEPLQTPQYDHVLKRSLVSLSAPGVGFDCKRYWEIPAAHAVLATWEHDLLIPNDFVSGKECLTFESLSQLRSIITNLSNEFPRLIEICNLGFEKLKLYHRSMNRANQILDVIYK